MRGKSNGRRRIGERGGHGEMDRGMLREARRNGAGLIGDGGHAAER